jgi:hypothetical protein
MRFARLILSVSVLSVLVLSLPAPQAHACSCMVADEESAFAQGNMIFHGEVTGIAEDSENWKKSVAFKVETVWQGPAVNGMVIYTGMDSAMCGVEFVVGEEYTVVANRSEGELWVSLCGQAYNDTETGEPMGVAEMVSDREPLVMNNDVMCVPYVCQDGTVHPSCTQDGSQINYFAEPCLTHGGQVGEEPEDETIPGATGGDFTDVPESHASFEAITWARQNGIVEGYADGSFKPKALVNRAEFVKILMGAYDADESEKMCKIAPFPDVEQPSWYAQVVHLARCLGVIGGYPDGTFRPSANINYAEAAKIIANLDSEAELTTKDGTMWYLVYTDYLKSHGAIVSSIKDVGQNITRAEMVELMYKLRGAPIPEEGSLTGTIKPIESPVEETGYEYVLVLDKPRRDPLSAMGPWAMVTQLVLVPTETVSQNTLKANVNAHVMVSGHMQWGYAESRVFAVEAIAVN